MTDERAWTQAQRLADNDLDLAMRIYVALRTAYFAGIESGYSEIFQQLPRDTTDAYWLGMQVGISRHAYYLNGKQVVGAGVETLTQALTSLHKERYTS